MGALVLIIEDNKANLELMTYLLSAFGHKVLTAIDGETGLGAAYRDAPDLILCDVQLPGLDGFGVASRLKSSPVMKKIPLVAVTAFAMVGDRDKVLSAGFDGYIAKPITPEIFVGQVEAFLQPIHQSRPYVAPPLTQSAPKKAGNLTILVVDNSSVNIDLARSTLEPFGYEIISAKSVQTALKLARQSPPDLILSDLHMPGENGYDLIKAIKQDRRLSQIPFVFISSTIWAQKDIEAGLEMGADEFITRPIDPERLVEKIRSHLPDKKTNHFDA